MVWVSQVRCLDWRRILPPQRAVAAELFRDKYRSFVSKERAEEKRRKSQEAAEKEAGHLEQVRSSCPSPILLDTYSDMELRLLDAITVTVHQAEKYFKSKRNTCIKYTGLVILFSDAL